MLISLSRSRGWRVPRDVAIVCMKSIRSIVELPPAITSMDRNYQRVGYEAAALLKRLIAGEPAPAKPILIPPRAVQVRESTDFLAVDDEMVSEALAYISRRLQKPLTVAEVAAAAAVSTRTLQLRFEAVVGSSVSEEIRRRRLEAAKRMLEDKQLNVRQIASRAGFGHVVTMNRVFQRELRMSPSAYRAQMLGDRG